MFKSNTNLHHTTMMHNSIRIYIILFFSDKKTFITKYYYEKILIAVEAYDEKKQMQIFIV